MMPFSSFCCFSDNLLCQIVVNQLVRKDTKYPMGVGYTFSVLIYLVSDNQEIKEDNANTSRVGAGRFVSLTNTSRVGAGRFVSLTFHALSISYTVNPHYNDIIAKFVIASIRSCTKISGSCIFSF